MDKYAKIDAYLEAKLDTYIEETSKLCAQPSVSAQRFGMREMAVLVREALVIRGFDVQVVETDGNAIVVGRLDGESDRTLLFYNHYDVQPADPLDLWTTPPFEPTVREGALFARGAKDDKGEFVARLAAVDAVREAYGGTLPCGVLFVVEGEEEIASPTIKQFVEEHLDLLQCHAAIWEEGGITENGHPRTTLGGRGVLGVQLSLQTMSRDAHSGNADVLPNAAWRLLWALASLKDENEKILIDGFYDDVKPVSEVDRQILAEMPFDEELYRKQFGIDRFLSGHTGQAFKEAVFLPTCNIQGITTGYQGTGMKTVIPREASAKLDFRLVPDQKSDDILEKLRSHLDTHGFKDIKIERYGAMEPYKARADDPFVTLVRQTGQEVYGKAAIVNPMGGGSSPMYAFGNPLGIPIAMAGVGYWDNKTHAPDEHVRLEDFLNATRHLARILVGFRDL